MKSEDSRAKLTTSSNSSSIPLCTTSAFSGRLDWHLTSQGQQVVRKIQPINDLSLAFTQAAADERLTGPLRELMDDDPVLMEEKLNYKQPLPQKCGGAAHPAHGRTISRCTTTGPITRPKTTPRPFADPFTAPSYALSLPKTFKL